MTVFSAGHPSSKKAQASKTLEPVDLLTKPKRSGPNDPERSFLLGGNGGGD